MAKIGVRNLNDIYRTNHPLGQAVDDLITHISNQKAEIETLKTLVAALQKKVG